MFMITHTSPVESLDTLGLSELLVATRRHGPLIVRRVHQWRLETMLWLTVSLHLETDENVQITDAWGDGNRVVSCERGGHANTKIRNTHTTKVDAALSLPADR